MAHSPAITPTGVKLEPKLKTRLKKLSEAKDRSVHWIMKMAIEQYVSDEESKELLRRETLARWHEAEQGKVVSNESVIAWLETWGTDQEKGRPE